SADFEEMGVRVDLAGAGEAVRSVVNETDCSALFIKPHTACALARNARTLAGSFSPGLRSTPEETSTASAREILTASARFSGLSPPESIQGSGQLFWRSSSQSKARALPPGRAP